MVEINHFSIVDSFCFC